MGKVMFEVLKALIIIPNSRTKQLGDLLAIAKAESKKRERTYQNLPIKSLFFVPECGVYVAIYETKGVQKPKVFGQRGV